MGTKGRLAALGAVIVLAVALGLVVCTDGGGNGAGPNGGGGKGPDGGPSSSLRDQGEKVADELLGATDTERPVASATGTVLTYGQGRQPAVAEVLSVEAGPADTLLRWRLKSTGPLLPLNPSTLRQSENSGVDAVDVALVDPAEQKLFLPPRFKTQDDFRCVCSLTPNAVDGRGQVLTGLYSLLSQGAGVVEVRIPGFPTIPNVPVKRG